jgi:DNA-binding beta-propeller fold protein YncE
MNRIAVALFLALALPAAALAQDAPAYRIVKTATLGAPDRWDYVVFDPASGRVYVAHGSEVTAVDGKSGAVLGHVTGLDGGTHGIAFARGKVYSDDGKAGIAASFDPKSFKIIHRIKAEDDADGIIFDKKSGHIFVIDGDSGKLTVVDPKSDTPIATIDGGGGLEFGVSGENGKLYIDGAEKSEIVRIDVKTNKADAHWPLTGCIRPHGLAIDTKTKRLFASCANRVMAVMNAESGTVLADVAIGEGTDFAMFDAEAGLAFSSNRDGTLSIVQEKSPDEFVALPPVETAFGARTMGLDPKNGRLYLVTAEFDENPSATDARHRYTIKPGTVKLLFLDPAKR